MTPQHRWPPHQRVPSRGLRVRRKSIAHVQVCLSVIVAASWYFWGRHLDPGESIRIASWAILITTAWHLVSWRLSGRDLFDVYPLFLCSATVFNGGQAILQALGLNPFGILNGDQSNDLVAQALALVLISLMFTHAGALVGMSGHRCPLSDAAPREQSRREVRHVGMALFAVSALPAAMAMAADLSAVMRSGYFSGMYQREMATGFASTPRLIAGLMPGALLFLLAGARRNPVSRWAPALTLAACAAVYLFIGFRGSALVIAAATLWLWERTVKPIRRTVLAGGLVAAMAILPVIGAVRDLSGEKRLDGRIILTAWASVDSPVVAAVSEMGGSLLTVVHIVNLVPSKWPYEYGSTYLYALLTIFPNIFWDIHPSIAHSPGTRLLWEVAPSTAANGGGIGFSYISEAFLNFGWLGAPIAVFLLGYGFGRLTRWLDACHDTGRLAVAATALMPLILYARSESGGVLRGVIWFAILPYLVVVILRQLFLHREAMHPRNNRRMIRPSVTGI